MKNLLWKASLKWALILTIIALLPQVVTTFAHESEGAGIIVVTVLSALNYIGMIVCLVLAHLEFHNRNGRYLSFGNAIIIGLIVLGIAYIVSVIYAKINYEFILKDSLAEKLSSFPEEFQEESDAYKEMKLVGNLIGIGVPIFILFSVILIESQWKIYKKASKPGWACLIPFYNIIVLLQIVKKPEWWLILFFIPFVNVIFAIWVTNLLSLRFGKSEGFTFGLLMLPFVFFPLLGLSKAEYIEDIKSSSE